MANYSTGSAAGTGATDAFFQIIRTALGANGWTEADVISNSSGSRDIVYKGTALDATADVRPWVRVAQSSNTLQFTGYSDWDTSTHTGINQCGGTTNSNMTLQDATFSYVLFINGLAMCIAAKIGGVWTHNYAGFLRRGFAPALSGITKTTAGYSAAATALAVASDMTGKLVVGQKVWIMNYAHASGNANAAHCELVTIAAIAAGTLTVSALANAYDSGAVIGARVCPLLVTKDTSGTDIGNVSNMYSPFHPDTVRSSATAQSSTDTLNLLDGVETSVDPEDNTALYGAGYFSVTSAVGSHTGAKGFPYGYYACAGGTQAAEDVMSDGSYTYLMLAFNAGGCVIIGPREV